MEVVLRETRQFFSWLMMIVCVLLTQAGGKDEIYLNGKFHRTIDIYPDGDEWKAMQTVWHVFGLKTGRRTLRLIVLGEPYADLVRRAAAQPASRHSA